ncbi:MAG: phosphoglucomutase/phosphomannomutase family protein, partial [Bacteroidota bacterium]
MYKIKFGTDGWRAIIADGYTLDNLTRVTEAMGSWLKDQSQTPSVLIGYDCRFNGRLFTEHVANILAQQGITVYIPSAFVSTPMVSLAVHKRQINAGIVITASHNPPSYSGFKIKGHYGGPALPDAIADVENRIPDTVTTYENKFEALCEAGDIRYFDQEALYLEHVKQNFDLRSIRHSGLKIGYDAMYGAGQTAFRKLFPEARLLHAEFNPGFNGTAPEPIEKNLKEFQSVIRAEGLDI